MMQESPSLYPLSWLTLLSQATQADGENGTDQMVHQTEPCNTGHPLRVYPLRDSGGLTITILITHGNQMSKKSNISLRRNVTTTDVDDRLKQETSLRLGTEHGGKRGEVA